MGHSSRPDYGIRKKSERNVTPGSHRHMGGVYNPRMGWDVQRGGEERREARGERPGGWGGQEQNNRNGDHIEGYQQGNGRGSGRKVQRISSINERWKIDRGRVRIV